MSDIVAEILLVEDNPADVRLTREALREAKLVNNLHVSVSGEDALQFLRREGKHAGAPRPDLVLLDLHLPGMSGRELLAAIKGTDSLREIPVVILTSSTAERDVVVSYQLGAACYVTKPVDLDQGVAIVQTLDEFWFSIRRVPTGAIA